LLISFTPFFYLLIGHTSYFILSGNSKSGKSGDQEQEQDQQARAK